MTNQLFGTALLWLAVIAVAVVVGFWVLGFLYRRASKEVAFVRTGFGGELVVISGGALVIPIIHETTPVGMGGVRLTASCAQQDAAITKDRLRVDVTAEFFLSVAPDSESVSLAASTLGSRTLQPESLADYFVGQLTAAIRSATTEHTLEEIQDSRAAFGDKIMKLAGDSLAASGVRLSSIALRNIDQSKLEFFNSSNRFDAEGLTSLISVIEERRKLRNDIEQAAMVEIRRRNLQAEQEVLSLEQQSTAARLEQERAIEEGRAAQQTAIEKDKAEQKAKADAARIAAAKDTSLERIEQERVTAEAEAQAKEQVEKARIASEASLDVSRVERDRALRFLEIERAEQVAAREVAKEISVLAEKGRLYASQAEADAERAKAAAAAEQVAGARDLAISRNEAEVSKVRADSEVQVAAQLAEARQIRAAAEAKAEQILNEAENVLSADARAGRIRERLIDKLETIIRESMRPLEKIDGFKVIHVGGGGGGPRGDSPLDEVIQSAMRYRVQAPLLDEVLKEIGLEGGKLASSADIVRSARDMHALAKETAKKAGDGK